MKNKVCNLSSYNFCEGVQILEDTNIGLYLFSAPTNPSSHYLNMVSTQYQRFLKSYISKGTTYFR
jgi:hypothetical protein